MIIKFKDGQNRQVLFSAELAARLLRLGHSIDFDPGVSGTQRKIEQALTQAAYNDLEVKDRCRGYTVS